LLLKTNLPSQHGIEPRLTSDICTTKTGTGDHYESASSATLHRPGPTARPTSLAQIGSGNAGFSICPSFVRHSGIEPELREAEKAIESKMVGFMLAHEQFTVSQVIDIGVSDVDGNDCYLSYVPI
jgi:hypothetical protein